MNNIQPSTSHIETEVEIIDLEEYSAQKRVPPKNRHYRVRINKEPFVFDIGNPTREQILEKGEFTPTKDYSLRLKIHGGNRLIHVGEHVDLTEPGVEKFKVLPLHVIDG